MAVPFIYSPSTIISSSEMNTNLAYVDYTDIDNNKAVVWRNAADSASGGQILLDTNDNMLYDFMTAGKAHVFRNHTPVNLVVIDSTNLSHAVHLLPSANNTYDQGNASFIYRYSYTNYLYVNTIAPITSTVDCISEFRMTGGSSARVAAYNTGSSKRIAIGHNDTNGLIEVSSGSLVILPAGGILSVEQSGVQNYLRAFDSGLTKNVSLYQDGSNGIFATSHGNAVVDPATGSIFQINKMPYDFQGTPGTAHTTFQYGAVYEQGDNTTNTQLITVTMPRAFANTNYVVEIMCSGGKGSAPSSIGDVNTAGGNYEIGCQYTIQDAQTFNLYATSTDGFVFGSGVHYMYSWIAVGEA